MIGPHLEHLTRPIDSVTPLPQNPRRGAVADIAASLQRYGQQTPIVTDQNNVIIKGNHTFLAAVQLGWTEIAAVTTTLTDTAAAGYALADNRTSDLAAYDDHQLAATLTALTADQDTTPVGYTDNDLAALTRHAARRTALAEGDHRTPTEIDLTSTDHPPPEPSWTDQPGWRIVLTFPTETARDEWADTQDYPFTPVSGRTLTAEPG